MNEARVVAKLRYGMRVDGLDRVMKGLESMYGPGLLIDTSLGDGKWMCICTPRPGPITGDVGTDPHGE